MMLSHPDSVDVDFGSSDLVLVLVAVPSVSVYRGGQIRRTTVVRKT